MFNMTAHHLILAQDDSATPAPGAGEEILPSVVGETDALGAGTTTTGGGDGTAAPPGLFGGSGFMIVLVMAFLAMIIFSFMGQRRDRKKREALIGAVKKHDKVQTVGGVIGSVVEVKSDTIVLKVDESANTRITFARSSIQQVLTSSSDSSSMEETASI